jgi:hypothetical protein
MKDQVSRLKGEKIENKLCSKKRAGVAKRFEKFRIDYK